MLKFPEHTIHGVDIYLCSLHLAVMENTDLCDREHVGLSKKNRNIQQREVWGVVARMIRPRCRVPLCPWTLLLRPTKHHAKRHRRDKTALLCGTEAAACFLKRVTGKTRRS